MLQKVRDQRPTYNNNKYITGSTTISTMKLLYYQIFAILYSAVGRCADLAIVNGSWTENHIRSLWSSSRWISNVKIVKIFPPCNTEEFSKVDISKPRQEVIVSIGQFRPEKDHALQIKAFIRLCEKLPKRYHAYSIIIRNVMILVFCFLH
jgi:alpha-1,2-mannosyltransferase